MPKQNPFSLYDFLGYFVPGASFLSALLALRTMVRDDVDSLDALTRSFPIQNAVDVLPFVILAYLAGHILSFVSSVTVERYSIWALGYPSQFLLGEAPEGFFVPKEPVRWRLVIRVATALFLLPIVAPDLLLGNLMRFREVYSRPLDPFLKNAIRDSLRNLLFCRGLIGAEDDLPANADFFRIAYHWSLEHAPVHVPKMHNYVALYGFMRTMCLVSVLATWVLVWINDGIGGSVLSSVLVALYFSAGAYLLFMGFMKFYRRFSLEVLMALTVSDVRAPTA